MGVAGGPKHWKTLWKDEGGGDELPCVDHVPLKEGAMGKSDTFLGLGPRSSSIFKKIVRSVFQLKRLRLSSI